MKTALVQSGKDIIVAVPVIEYVGGDAVTSGQAVNLAIQRVSDSLWWNTATSAFDLVAEPSPAAATQNGSTGVYELALSDGYDGESLNYFIRLNLTGTVARNFYQYDQLLEDNSAVLAAANRNYKSLHKILELLEQLKRKQSLIISSMERTKKGRV